MTGGTVQVRPLANLRCADATIAGQCYTDAPPSGTTCKGCSRVWRPRFCVASPSHSPFCILQVQLLKCARIVLDPTEFPPPGINLA
jgi:hypothetical protein